MVWGLPVADDCILIERCPSVSVQDLLPEVLFSLDGMPAGAAANYVVKAARMFCKRTRVLRQYIDVYPQACVGEYPAHAACEMDIVAIHQEHADGACSFSSNRASMRFVPPHSFHMTPPPQSDRDEPLRVLVSVAPRQGACHLPAELFDRYGDALTAGALHYAHRVTGTPFFNLALSREMDMDFKAAMNAAAVDRLLEYRAGPIRMRPNAGRFV